METKENKIDLNVEYIKNRKIQADKAEKDALQKGKVADELQVKANTAQAVADKSGLKTDQKLADVAQDKADNAQAKANV